MAAPSSRHIEPLLPAAAAAPDVKKPRIITSTVAAMRAATR